jgi:hypothetical protein
MHRVLIESFGRPIRISNDDYVPLINRLFSMVEKQIKGVNYDEERLDSLIKDLEDSILFSKVGEKLRKLKNESMAN